MNDIETNNGRVIKDANDVLRFGMAELTAYGDDQGSEEGVARVQELVGQQIERVRLLLKRSRTMVEECARWAGQADGSEKDQRVKMTFSIIKLLPKVDRSVYRERLVDLLGIGVREYNDILKAAMGDKEGDDGPGIVIETLGGFESGWLLEYIYNPEEKKGLLAYRDPERKMGTAEYVDIEGIRYAAPTPSKFITDGGVLFASELGNLKPTRELTGIVEAMIHQHYLLENKYLGRIIAYYVLMTWVYDCFNALPYLRAMGEAGAGKSELMRRIGHLCYRMMSASGANTGASFFRATEKYRGTVFLDEADLHDGGDMSNDLVKFLNLGAMKGNPIWRLEEVLTEGGGKSYEVATFQTFCPKLIAMRRDFKDDAVGSRSLTIKLMPREPIELKARGIRLYIDEEFRKQAAAIRNLLLRWRFEHWEPEIEVTEEMMDLNISSRLNQVTMPMKALAKDDPELRTEMETFLQAYNREMVLTRSMTIAARVVEALWKIWGDTETREKYLQQADDGVNWYVMIGDVAKVADAIMDEMNATDEEGESEETKKKGKKDKLTARGVGSLVRNELQLYVGERRGKGFPVYWDAIKMEALAKRYGVSMELPAKPAVKVEPKQEQIPF